MINYLIKRDDNTYIVQGYLKKPKRSVGEVPGSIDPVDYPYLTLDENNNVVVDSDKKAQALINIPQQEQAEAMKLIRIQRDLLLKESDFSQLPDSPFDNNTIEEWKQYRQELRDFPNNVQDPFNPDWPVKP